MRLLAACVIAMSGLGSTHAMAGTLVVSGSGTYGVVSVSPRGPDGLGTGIGVVNPAYTLSYGDGGIVVTGTFIDTGSVPLTGYYTGRTLADLTPLVTGSGPNGTLTVTQWPAAGSEFTEAGPFLITFTGSNAGGDYIQAQVDLTVSPYEVLAYTGETAPGAGNTVYAAFDAPELGAFEAEEQTGNKKAEALFAPDGDLMAVAGSGFTFDNPSGDAVLATQSGLTELYTGLASGEMNEIISGNPSSGHSSHEVLIRAINEIDGNGADTFFLESREGEGINSTNDSGLQVVSAGQHNKILTSGEELSIGGAIKTVSSFSTLKTSEATPAQGRWRMGDTGFGALLTMTDKSQMICVLTASGVQASLSLVAETGTLSTIAGLEETVGKSFGLPCFSADTVSCLVNLTHGVGGVTSDDDVAIFCSSTVSSFAVAIKGAPAPDVSGSAMNGITFKSFSDPVSGAEEAAAFEAELAGKGLNGGDDEGIWYTAAAGETPLVLVARTGTSMSAPGGGSWTKFTSMVLPDYTTRAGGPIFMGELAVNAQDGVTSKSNTGLWAVDSTGALELLFRSGQSVTVNGISKTVKSFTALESNPGSTGAASGYDDEGDVAIRATFTDGSEALVEVTVL